MKLSKFKIGQCVRLKPTIDINGFVYKITTIHYDDRYNERIDNSTGGNEIFLIAINSNIYTKTISEVFLLPVPWHMVAKAYFFKFLEKILKYPCPIT